MKKILFSSLFILANVLLFSQEKSRYDLMLMSGTVLPPPNADKLTGQRAVKDEIVAGKYWRFIQFYQIPSEEEKKSLSAMGVDLLQYLPNFSFFASISTLTDLSRINSSGNIRTLIPVLPEYKVHYTIKDGKLPEDSETIKGMADITVTFYKGITSDVVIREIRSDVKNVKVLMQDDASQMIRLRVKKKHVGRLADVSCIQYIEPTEKWKLENNSGTGQHRSNMINNNIWGGLSYDGTGVGVSVGDGGAYFGHVDFTGRHKGAATPGASHGTHVAGTIGGAGNINPRNAGQAPGVNMTYSDGWDDIASVSAISALYNGVDSVRVTNHSLAESQNAGYTSTARQSDLQVEALPALFNVHSAGNAGSNWFTITGGYKAGKNSIATGNLDYKDAVNSSSSRGPSKDGRIKPDICAKGTNVQSCMPANGYGPMTGTSMSAPGATGCFAQLIEMYRAFNGGVDPKLALLKGIVMNSADDLGLAGPDYTHGWGRINVWNAYNTIKDQRFFSDSISQSGLNKHTIQVPSNVAAVKVMVYWADPAAAAGVTKALINDIDILLASTSQNHGPWELDFSSPSNAAIVGQDHDNNVEQVYVAAPSAGTYTLNVSGYLVPQGPQEYWVTYEFITDDVKVIFPVGGEAFVPGELEIIRWDAFGNTGTFTIEYSSDSGATWNVLSSTVAGNLRHHQWTVPNTLTGNALVRVSRGNKSSISQADFTIMQVPTALNIDWRCPASFQLSWTAVAGATSYEAYLLGQKYMIPQGTTTGTSFWIQSPNTAVTWASVRALAANGQAISKRAIAIQVPTAVTGCLTSTEDISMTSSYDVSVYPNPMSGNATVFLKLETEEYLSVRLMDFSGREITTIEEGTLPAGEHQFDISNTVAAGIYFLVVKGAKGVTFEKLVVEGR